MRTTPSGPSSQRSGTAQLLSFDAVLAELRDARILGGVGPWPEYVRISPEARDRLVELLEKRESQTHLEKSFMDYGKSFRSRPGSADWRAACSCGWESKVWYYGKSGAHKGWLRHFDRAEHEAWKAARA